MSLNLDTITWKRVAFGDVIDSITDRVNDPSEAGVDRYVGLEHLDPGVMTVQRWDTPNKVAAQKLRFKPNDVIFGRRRAYQKKVAMAEFEGICSAHALVLRARPDYIHPDFLPVFLSSDYFLERAISISVGSLSPTVNWRDLKVQEFDLPPLGEQQRIADLLWSLERHRRGLQFSRLALQSLVQQLRDAEFAKQSWDGLLGSFLVGITAGRSLAASSAAASPHTFGVLKVSAVGAEGFVPSENKELLDQAGFMPQFAVRHGDLLVTRANTAAYVGRPAIVDGDYPNLMLSDKTLRLNVDSAKTTVEFLREFLLTSRTRAAIAEVATGTGAAMKNISQADVLAVPVPTFTLQEQQAIVKRVETVRVAVASVDRELAALATLRAAALAETFGGNG